MPDLPINLRKTPLHLGSVNDPERTVQRLEDFGFDGPAFEHYEAQVCGDEIGRIVMMETSQSDWPMWECHPGGDEIVVVLEGRGTFFQELPDGLAHVPVIAGDCIVNPRGVWHTADVADPLTALYITPGPGTQHRPR